ncbi:electron transfer flavoprotein subunit alpha/FixB family protein [Desulfuromonas carbonis]|uniref:electron transfer flavoprotein subunit alpha/FixB family protein n=1 Tax=Desulfuromonas sp. DDH964 TaxID=1823759 RepID=UPI00078D8DD6|nr:electron transfer flavoprotein subunit alpha/FixB family protein [Desulfuromonas sp. DDH964]AMV70853.1 electron transfer flavoprotein subunit alpha [Desulfuromonas sp. DDH964]
MKALLVAESRQGELLAASYEPLAFAQKLGAQSAMFLVGSRQSLPQFDGPLYFADAGAAGDYQPDLHKALLQQAIEKEQPELVVFCHSSYGWDLAPRLAAALSAPQISEVIDVVEGGYLVPACNAKLRRTVAAKGPVTIVTLQAGAFSLSAPPAGTPQLEELSVAGAGSGIRLTGYEAAEKGGVDLGKAEVIVSAGRGIGKPENLALIEALAKTLHGEYGASRPVVDAGWADHSRQVGSTGQTVAPKLYVACGISGAIQHLAGMKKSDYIVAINTDKEAPIGEIADVLVVADLKQFVPALTAKLAG